MNVLGALLIEIACCADVMEHVSKPEFYRGKHQAIYAAITELFVENGKYDITLVKDRLAHMGELDAAGGGEYLMQVAAETHTAAHAILHAQTVRRLSQSRALVLTCRRTIGTIFERQYLDDSELLALRAGMQAEIEQAFKSDRLESIQSLLVKTLNEQARGQEPRPKVGLLDMDANADLFEPGALTIVAGTPGMGKTTFLRHLIRENQKYPSLLVTCEEPKRMFSDKQLCLEADVRYEWTLKKRTIAQCTEAEREKLIVAAGALSAYELTTVDGSMGAQDVAMYARRMAQIGKPPRVVYVDHFQHMRHERQRGENDAAMFARSVYTLASLAKELNGTVVLASQLSRDVDKPKPRRPRLSDLKDTSALEQVAFNVLFLWAHRTEDTTRFMWLAKQRNGAVFEAEVMFDLHKGRFMNLARS